MNDSILKNKFKNKDTAFTNEEREKYHIIARLPAKIESINDQISRIKDLFSNLYTPLEKWMFLQRLKEQNEILFTNFALENIKEVLPIIYTPTIGQACTLFSQIWQGLPTGLYLNVSHIGKVSQILMDATKLYKPQIIVATDGSRILGLGQLGQGGQLIAYGKLSLYQLCYFNPETILPISFDFGCDKQEILQQTHYLGIKQQYTVDEKYYQLIDETINAIYEYYPHCVFQFEDFNNKTAFKLLQIHRQKHHLPVFNDDIQGTGVIAAATVYSAIKGAGLRTKRNITASEQRYVLYGAGAGAIGVAQFIQQLSIAEGNTKQHSYNQFCVIDTQGLITTDRNDYLNGTLAKHKIQYARKDMKNSENKTLLEVIKNFKPTCLLGLSTSGNSFTKEILNTMQKQIDRDPIILALSNPTQNCEVTAQDAFDFLDDKLFYASGSPFQPVLLQNGQKLEVNQCNNLYVFPGIGAGAINSHCYEITDSILVNCGIAISQMMNNEELIKGKLLPDIENIREITIQVAYGFIKQALKEGKCQNIDYNITDDEIKQLIKKNQWNPSY